MPRIRTSIARGVVTVAATPALVVFPLLFVLGEWLVLVAALGFQGPVAALANALALPPTGTSFDARIATALFGLQGGLFGVFGFLLLRAVVTSLLIAMILEALESGGVSRWGLLRSLSAFPVALATNVIGVGVLTISSFLGPLLGVGFGLLIQVVALVLGVYLFAFAPVIAAWERRKMPEALARSIRAARMPGAGNLTMAALYVVPSIAVLVAPGVPGSLIGVNPSIGAWAFVLVASLIQVAILAAFAYRYVCVADDVPEAPPPRVPAGRRR
jgi:hypothetical protein